jgi:Cu+-exporting ATPase
MLLQSIKPEFQAGTADHQPTWHVDLEIGGMTCAQCPPFVKKWLRGYPGVRRVSVRPDTAVASIDYDPREVTLKDLINLIRAAGCTAGVAMIRIPTKNLRSASRAFRVENTVAAIAGVLSANADPATATIDVKCKPEKVDSDDLLRRVARIDLPEALGDAKR